MQKPGSHERKHFSKYAWGNQEIFHLLVCFCLCFAPALCICSCLWHPTTGGCWVIFILAFFPDSGCEFGTVGEVWKLSSNPKVVQQSSPWSFWKQCTGVRFNLIELNWSLSCMPSNLINPVCHDTTCFYFCDSGKRVVTSALKNHKTGESGVFCVAVCDVRNSAVRKRTCDDRPRPQTSQSSNWCVWRKCECHWTP